MPLPSAWVSPLFAMPVSLRAAAGSVAGWRALSAAQGTGRTLPVRVLSAAQELRPGLLLD